MQSILRNVRGAISGPPLEQMNDLINHIEIATATDYDENPISEYIDTNYDINSITNNYHYNHLSINTAVSIINKVYSNSLTDQSQRLKANKEYISKDLYNHQEALLAAMINKERELTVGPYYNRVGILGAASGSGKTLTTLAHIAYTKSLGEADNISCKSVTIYNSMYSNSVYDISYNYRAPILVVVSEYAFADWKENIRQNTFLNPLYIEKPADIRKLQQSFYIKDTIQEHDFILLNATHFNKFIEEIDDEMIIFKRVYIDSPESINLKRNAPLLNAGFIWFITNAWQLFLPNIIFYTAAYIRSNLQLDTEWAEELQESLQSSTNAVYPINFGYFEKYHSYSSHNYKQVIRCRADFIKQSMSLGDIQQTIIPCKISRALKASINILTNKVRKLMDESGALVDDIYEELGVEFCTKNTINNIISANINKEFYGLLGTNTACDAAINKSLADKKSDVLTRINNSKECPVCFEDISEAIYMPCCHNLVCNKCGINIITQTCKMKCIYCRTNNTMNDIKYIHHKDIIYPNIPTKSEMIYNYIRDLSGKAIIYANYEREFRELLEEFNKRGLKYTYIPDYYSKVAIKRIIKECNSSKHNSDNIKIIMITNSSLFKSIAINNITHIITLYRLKHEHKNLVISTARANNPKQSLEYVSFLYQEGMHDTINDIVLY